MARGSDSTCEHQNCGRGSRAWLSFLTVSVVPLIDDVAIGILLLASGKHQVHHKRDVGTHQSW